MSYAQVLYTLQPQSTPDLLALSNQDRKAQSCLLEYRPKSHGGILAWERGLAYILARVEVVQGEVGSCFRVPHADADR
jgi:hypothetical protein